MKKPKRPVNRDRNSYYRALVSEILEGLGMEIHRFRHLQSAIGKTMWGKEISPDVLFLLDSIYQASLDGIFDSLANAQDLKVGNVAIDGCEKAMRVRRGLCKKADVL